MYASSVSAENPYRNFAYNVPEINVKGVIPSVTKVRAQLEVNAITKPQTNDAKLAKLIPIIDDVRPLINLQSTDNLLVSVPALFLGSSKKEIGILNNFLNVSDRNLSVNLSPT